MGQYFAIYPKTHSGYPMPDNDFGYLEKTFDLSHYCNLCATGAIQKAPFRLSKPPNEKKELFQLNWVYDEFFVRTDIWKNVFSPFQIDARPVIQHKNGETIPTFVQLRIDKVAQCPVKLEGLRTESCKVCGKTKYGYHKDGPCNVPQFLGECSGHILKLRETWGGGGAAWNPVVVSLQLKDAIISAKVKGVTFEEMR